MLRVVAHTSAAAARQYYASGLKREDYYSQGQEVVGKWGGKAAERLGITGDVAPEAFSALVENRHPLSGEKLTPRTNQNRRVGYDVNFHAPKSLSVLYALTGDKEVLMAFRAAVADTMNELEEFAETRVRKSGACSNRVTGNLAWAEFVHFTSRPVGGVPDPHLHIHNFVFNITHDFTEGRWKAGEFASLKKEAHCAEAAFHARLTTSLVKLGYGIRRTKNGWELEGMPASVIAKFSRRTAQIERRAEELGIKDAKAKDALGAATREGKRQGASIAELRAEWESRLTAAEKLQIDSLRERKGQAPAVVVTPAQAVDYALAKHFERQSVAERGHLLATALRFGAGQVGVEAIRNEFERRQLIGRKVGDDHICTSEEVLAEEIALLAFVRSGRGSAMALGGRKRPSLSASLSAEQRAAALHLLTSRDQVLVVRGGAGTGKTTMMVEVCAAIERQGLKVYAFAPSADASRGTLRAAGFENAETVAHLLINQKLQERIQGQVVWIDEAGLLGVRDLHRIMEVVGTGTRVILTGDAAQHAPVARGDAFRILQKYAGLRIAEVSEIRRQQVEDYRLAIASLSKGDLKTGFRRLEQLGAFVEIEDEHERYQTLAADYVALGRRGTFPLVVSPTHAESAKVTEAIRAARREAGQIGPDRRYIRYHNLQWEEVEREVADNYSAGLFVQFHQNAKGIKRGESFRVVGRSPDGSVQMQKEGGEVYALPLNERGKFMVYEEREIDLAKGDKVRITKGGSSENGKRLDNGMNFEVAKFGKNGEIVLSNGAILAANHGHLAHGYCQTSHSAQSKSVRDVLVAQSRDSAGASSREQFYVSCSRGKETIRIYTDDRQHLQEAVGVSSRRMAGMELAGLSQKDVSNYIGGAVNSKQWREKMVSLRGVENARSFVRQLTENRKINEGNSAQNVVWKGYAQLRKKASEEQPQNVKKRLVNAYQSAAEHFRKMAGKITDKQPKATTAMGRNKIPRAGVGDPKRAAQHRAREKAAAARKATAIKAKASKVKAKQVASRPVVRR